MHDKKSCGNITCMTRKVVAFACMTCIQYYMLTASRTMLVYCCRTDTQLGYRPGRASFSSLSSDASASTFAGRRDAVYGARRSVSGSSRKACELCVTLLDLCLFGLKFAAQAQPKMSMNVYSNSIWCIHFLMFACLVVVQTQLQDVNEALVHVAL